MESGNFVLSDAMGVADRARNRLVDRGTRFNIGSVSKMFATAAILLLVDEGKVALDAPVVRYLPEFTMADARFSDITLRMLLNHFRVCPDRPSFLGLSRIPPCTGCYLTPSSGGASSTRQARCRCTATTDSHS